MQYSITSFSLAYKLKNIIRNLTSLNLLPLDGRDLKELTSLLKQSNESIEITFNLLITQLQFHHAQIRFAAFIVIEHLFIRSRIFRDLLVAKLKLIIQLTTGIQSSASLPGPKIFAEKLCAKSLTTMEKWMTIYGIHYPRLRVAFKYIQVNKNSTNNFHVLSNVHQIQQDYQERIRKAFLKKEVEKISCEMDEVFSNIDEVLQECNTCFELLIPKLSEFASSENICTDFKTENITSKHECLGKEIYGTSNVGDNITMCFTSSNFKNRSLLYSSNQSQCLSISYNIKENLNSEIQNKENEMNTDLFQPTSSYNPHKSQSIEKFVSERCSGNEKESLPFIWYDQSSPEEFFSDSNVSDSEEDNWEVVIPLLPQINEYPEDMYKELRLEIDLSKQKIQIILSSDNECILEKLQNLLKTLILRLSPLINKWLTAIGKSDSSNLFSNVIPYKIKIDNAIEKAKLLEIVNVDLNQRYSLLTNSLDQVENKYLTESLASEDYAPFDPTTFQAQPYINPHSTSSFDNNFIIENDLQLPNFHKKDLFSQWEKDTKIEQLPRYEGYHSYWVTEPENGLPSDAAIGMLQNRIFTYSEEFKPVLHTCDASIGNGKFCKRRDRLKCPFHGNIHARNTLGKPLEESYNISSISSVDDDYSYNLEGNVGNIPNLRNILGKISNKKRGKIYLANKKMQILYHKQFKKFNRPKLEKILLNKRQLLKESELLKSEMLERNKANFIHNFNYSLKS